MGSSNDESVFVSPFELSKHHTVIMPVYYDVEIPIYPRSRTVANEEELTTFRPYKPTKREMFRNSRREPLHPN